MVTETLSSLENSLIAIVLVWGTALIIGQIIRVAVSSSLNNIFARKNGAKTQETKSKAQEKVRIGCKLFNISITSATIVTLVVFLLFMNNREAANPQELNTIQPASLPVGFKTPSAEEIEASNEEAVNHQPREANKQAEESNTKAMNDAINLFKNVKKMGREEQ